jgi:hypothetical protein
MLEIKEETKMQRDKDAKRQRKEDNAETQSAQRFAESFAIGYRAGGGKAAEGVRGLALCIIGVLGN